MHFLHPHPDLNKMNSPESFCRCCLLNADTENELRNMKKETFSYNNQSITFLQGYFETTSSTLESFFEIPIAESMICQFCVNEMENAYVFRELCKEANDILKRKYEQQDLTNPSTSSAAFQGGSQAPLHPLQAKRLKQKELLGLATTAGAAATEALKSQNNENSPINRRSPKVKKAGKSVKPSPHDSSIAPAAVNGAEISLDLTKKRKSKDLTSSNVLNHETVQVVKTPSTKRTRSSKEDDSPLSNQEVIIIDDPIASTPQSSRARKQNERDTTTKSSPETDNGVVTMGELQPLDAKTIASLIFLCEEGYQCTVCEKMFQSKQYVYRHIKNHYKPKGQRTPDTLRIFPCKIGDCTRVFICRSGLSKHHNKEHLKKVQKCNICQKVFKSRSGLHSHTKSDHLNIRFECLICAQEFKAINALKEHNRIQHQNVRLDCKICKEKFRKLQDLWAHSFKHRSFMPFNCDAKDCDYKTAIKSNYKWHLKKHDIVFNEKIHGYNKETRDEVLNFVRADKQPGESPTPV
jgi:hypothetical protein